MLAAVVRSGVVEAVHEGAVAVVDADGDLIAHSGDIDRRFYARSSLKPFQARAALDLGSGLTGAHLAITCASHPATPAHVALVADVLDRAGLSEAALHTPAVYPNSRAGLQYVDPHAAPRSIWHNCSGKHAGMLVASVAGGLDVHTYAEPSHPLQGRIARLVGEVTEESGGDPGVDGCGAPAFESSLRGLARAFRTLALDPAFAPVRSVMQRHPRLVGDTSWIDVEVMVWLDAIAKAGAEGVVGVGLPAGFGIAVKAWDGSERAVFVGVAEVLRQLGFIDTRSAHRFELAVTGGGRPVGRVEPRLELQWT